MGARNHFFYGVLLMPLLTGLFFTACKKPVLEDTVLIPDDERNLRFTDTLTVLAFTTREDSVDVSLATLCLLGTMYDPDFGTTSAGSYIPFRLINNNLSLGVNPQLDSIVLTLRYFNTYGKTDVPQTLEVYEMTEEIVANEKYFSNKNFTVNPAPVGRLTNFVPNLTDSVEVINGKLPAVLRIKLDNSFGQKFINASGTGDYADQTAFRQFFKGLYIKGDKADGGEGLIFLDPFFDPIRLGLILYYKDDNRDSVVYNFPTFAADVVNHYEHDYTGSTVEPFLNGAGSGDDSLVFFQGLAGLNVKFMVPHLAALGNILINKAEIVVTQVNAPTGADTLFTPPLNLVMVTSDADGKLNALAPDQLAPYASLFGGEKISATDNHGVSVTNYKFNLSQYFQRISDGEDNFGIFILPNRRDQSAVRMIAGGSSHSQYRLKLNLTYTIIE